MPMLITPPKLKAILLYFCENTDSKYLGKVKLMKLFYFLDFGYVKKYGMPITGDVYVNLEHGPIPSTIKNLVDNVADDIDHSFLADTIEIERPENTFMQRVVAVRKFTPQDAKLFTESEMEMLKLVSQRFAHTNTDTIEKASHEEAPWLQTEELEVIPYTLAAEDKDSQVTKEDIELFSQL
jgi:uncharacterized phage-associated protein